MQVFILEWDKGMKKTDRHDNFGFKDLAVKVIQSNSGLNA